MVAATAAAASRKVATGVIGCPRGFGPGWRGGTGSCHPGCSDTTCCVWLHFRFSSGTKVAVIGLLIERFWCMIWMQQS
jgi:hypothetical protein